MLFISMTINVKLGGWKRQAASLKDHTFLGVKARIAEATTSEIDLRRWCSPVEDQGRLGSCVANAVVGGLELLNIRFGRPHVDLSRLFVYYNARLFMNAADKDEGTYVRLGMNVLEALGSCEENLWPYVPGNVFIRPKWKCYSTAYGHKIGRYELIKEDGNSRLSAIEDALSGGYPVAFGMNVDQGFMNTGNDGMIHFGGPDMGGHATLIVGCFSKKKLFIGRNSWGQNWGDKGYYYLPYEALTDQDAADFWIPYETPTFVK